jgi:hypothetical protein
MSEPRTYQLTYITALFCIGVERHSDDVVVSGMTELGGQ